MVASEATTVSSEVKSDLRFETGDPNYLLNHVHIAYMIWALLAASKATIASKQPQRSNLTSDLNSVASTYVSIVSRTIHAC